MPATLQTMRSGGTEHPEEIMSFLLSRLIKTSGVFDKAANHFLVAEESSPAMSVKITQGYAMLTNSTNSMCHPVRLYDADSSVAITSNASGNSRIDAIVLYIDRSASPNAAVTNVATLVAVAGTPAGSPAAPTDNEIQTSVGASNPFIRLANVTVASGATTILTANISDQRSNALWHGRIEADEDFTTLTDAATIDIDVNKGRRFKVTLGGNRTFTISNGRAGKLFLVLIKQDGTGSRTLTWFNKSSTFTTGNVDTGTEIITVGRDIPTATPIRFSSTTAVPAGLVAATRYYAINVSATTIKVASSIANAQAGTAINLTDVGTGTHTITTEIRWGNNDTIPTLSTGKYRYDLFGIVIEDWTNGIFEGVVISQDN